MPRPVSLTERQRFMRNPNITHPVPLERLGDSRPRIETPPFAPVPAPFNVKGYAMNAHPNLDSSRARNRPASFLNLPTKLHQAILLYTCGNHDTAYGCTCRGRSFRKYCLAILRRVDIQLLADVNYVEEKWTRIFGRNCEYCGKGLLSRRHHSDLLSFHLKSAKL